MKQTAVANVLDDDDDDAAAGAGGVLKQALGTCHNSERVMTAALR